MQHEREKGVLDADTQIISSITSHAPGYLDRSLEQIIGLQTEKPLKRAIMLLGGIRVVKSALEACGYQLDPQTEEIFTNYRKTHNDGVFDAYSRDMRLARHSGIITGLPDAYGRGRIIGDYRRVALYGCDRLISDKKAQFQFLESDSVTDCVIRLREEISEQIRALAELKDMAASYGFDISRPAANAQEAVQWLYFGYLGVVKEQNGAVLFNAALRRCGILRVNQISELFDHGRSTRQTTPTSRPSTNNNHQCGRNWGVSNGCISI
jgi:formate C-acetyltransferase